MGAGHGQLFVGHVHAHDLARGAHQLCQCVHIAARATAQVQHAAAFQQGRAHQAAAVVAREHLRVDLGQQGFEPLGHLADVAAGGGLEIGRAAELLAVIVLNQVMHGQGSCVGDVFDEDEAGCGVVPVGKRHGCSRATK